MLFLKGKTQCFLILCYVNCLVAITVRDYLLPNRAKLIKIVERNNQIVLEEINLKEVRGLSRLLKRVGPTYYKKILNQLQGYLKKSHRIDGMKKILVKRAVPFGDQGQHGIEYDPKYRTYFRPLYKVTKPRKEDAIFSRNALLQPFNKYATAYQDVHDTNFLKDVTKLILEIKNKIKYVHSRKLREKTYSEVLDVVDTINKLRTDTKPEIPIVPVQSFKDREPEKNNDLIVDLQDVVKKHIPFYNYWQYKDTIYQDECPGSMVKIGHVCSWTPDHRRRLRRHGNVDD